MKRRVLVTGASGFAGGHLARRLGADTGIEIFGAFDKRHPAQGVPGTHMRMRLDDHAAVRDAIKDIKPDEVYHLAAMSSPAEAAHERVGAYASNVSAPLYLLDSLASIRQTCNVLLISSAEVYGAVSPEENPVFEKRQPRPAGHYGASKYCMEIIARQFAANQGMHIVVARPFNHTGPGQSEKFAAPAFAMQIARIEAGLAEPVIRTGSLDAKRDFADVRDVTGAYPALLSKGASGEAYNVCSGTAVSIRHVLDTLLGLSTVKGIRHEYDPAKMRKSENPEVFGDHSKLTAITGWRPRIPLEKTLADLLDDCRKRVKE
ncbi:MAG: GDP-mannose 4,6-dehydratase [Nitrospinae bacterium]|nr:GDP-mannose 4,6-dehydratase [Nitrospinota bacterium]